MKDYADKSWFRELAYKEWRKQAIKEALLLTAIGAIYGLMIGAGL